MSSNFFKNNCYSLSGLSLNAFTSDDLDAIHNASLEVFEESGIKVESDETLDIFEGAGAKVERTKGYGIVRIPAHIVEDCIRWAPGRVVYKGRTPEYDFVVEPNRISFSTFGECLNVIDLETREHRPSIKADNAAIARLCDSFDEIGMVLRPVGSGDAPPQTQAIHNAEALFNNTSKHLHVAAMTGRNLKTIIRMAAAFVGGMEQFAERPIFTCPVCPTSPLTLVKDCCDMIILTGRTPGAGIQIISMALAGTSGPATLAGTLVNHNVEVLSALILAQLVRKGTRCVYASVSTIMDMKRMVAAVGAPEMALLSVAAARMAQYYKLPSLVGGGLSDSKLPDAQAAYEASLSMMLGALAGANFVFGLGVLEQGMTFDFAKFMMDMEMAQMINRILRGIPVSDDTIAMDVIREAGPGGEFLTKRHTLTHMRELSQSSLFDRRTRSQWLAAGGKDLTERAYEAAQERLKNYQPEPVAEDVRKEVRTIVEEYEAELGL